MPFITSKNAPGIIAKAMANRLADKVQFAKAVSKADPSDFDGKNGFSAGDTIYIAQPARYTVGSNANITSAIQNTDEGKVPLALDIRAVVGVANTSLEFATDIALKSYIKRVIDPAVDAVAQSLDRTFIERASRATYNFVGTPGSTVFDTQTCLQANQRITEMACPDMSDRFMLLYPEANTSAVNTRKGLFQQSTEIAKQYREGYIGTADGFNYLQNNLAYRHTNGSATVTAVTLSANQTSGTATAAVTGLTGTNTVTAGTIINIAGVFAVHPITKQNLGFLQDFVVTADATAVSSAATLSISPTPISSGSEQNVTAVGASSAAVTFRTGGATLVARPQALAFHKSAFRVVSVPMLEPKGVDMLAQETVDGLTIRILRQYDVLQDRLVTRIDALCGIAIERPEWACRIGG